MATGVITPTSLEIVLLFANSININRTPQTKRVDKMAPKLKSEIFKNRTLIGTKKKIITIKHGTKNG